MAIADALPVDTCTLVPEDCSLSGTLLEFNICFLYEQETWSHSFSVPRGSTLLDLKRCIVQRGDQLDDDSVSFELRRRGVRVPNLETLELGGALDFEFVGVDDGRRRLERDHAAERREFEALELARSHEAESKRRELESPELARNRDDEEALVAAQRREIREAEAMRALASARAPAPDNVPLPRRPGEAGTKETQAPATPIRRRWSGAAGTSSASKSTTASGVGSSDASPSATSPVPKAAAASLPLTRQRALHLQEELHTAFASERFQAQFRELLRDAPRSAEGCIVTTDRKLLFELNRRRQSLVLEVQKEVLPRYGFEGSASGVAEMLKSFRSFGGDEAFLERGSAIERLIAF